MTLHHDGFRVITGLVYLCCLPALLYGDVVRLSNFLVENLNKFTGAVITTANRHGPTQHIPSIIRLGPLPAFKKYSYNKRPRNLTISLGLRIMRQK